VISLIDSERVYRFEWTSEPDSGFDYVEHVQATYDFGFRRIEHQEFTDECLIRVSVPMSRAEATAEKFNSLYPAKAQLSDLNGVI
jgi:hypothetical protein